MGFAVSTGIVDFTNYVISHKRVSVGVRQVY